MPLHVKDTPAADVVAAARVLRDYLDEQPPADCCDLGGAVTGLLHEILYPEFEIHVGLDHCTLGD
jgi:hypothetical protein